MRETSMMGNYRKNVAFGKLNDSQFRSRLLTVKSWGGSSATVFEWRMIQLGKSVVYFVNKPTLTGVKNLF